MYVPALKGQGATESGHRNYQSPTRTSSEFGPSAPRWTVSRPGSSTSPWSRSPLTPRPGQASPGLHQVKVPGVGEVRARALESWRASLEQRARQSAPTAVSAQERTTIRQQFAAEKKRHEAEIAQAKLTDATTTHDLMATRLAIASTEHHRAFSLRRYLRCVATGR